MSAELSCPAGFIIDGSMFGCSLTLGHEHAHWANAAGVYVWWWGAMSLEPYVRVGFLRAVLEDLAGGEPSATAARWLEIYHEQFPPEPAASGHRPGSVSPGVSKIELRESGGEERGMDATGVVRWRAQH